MIGRKGRQRIHALAGGDVVRTVHVLTAAQFISDFPGGRVNVMRTYISPFH